MPKEKDDILQANAGAPAANIPDLKKKEKERKKAGAAWSGARGAASEFSGATGGNVARAAASAVGAAGEGAAELSAELATSSLLGRMAITAAAFLMVAAAGLLGYARFKGNGSANLGNPNLGGIADSMHVRAGGDDRLGVNSKGELRFDPLSAAKAPAAPPPADAKAADEKPAPDVKADVDAQRPVASGQLAHNLSGAQLSSSLGGDFGSKNIFAGNSNAPKFGAGAAGLKNYPGSPGKLGKMKASTVRASPSARSVNKGSANKAFGQLRLAKGLSQMGAGATSAEDAAAASQGAFDQQQPTGGNLATTGAPGSGDTPPSLGAGAPDTSVPSVPVTPTHSTDPGLQNALQQIQDMANKGMADIQSGTMKELLGAILVVIGIGFGWPWGIIWIVIGLGLIMMGQSEVAQGKEEIAMAQEMGSKLASSIGNQEQGAAIKDCTAQMAAAANAGNSMTASQCNEDSTVHATDHSAKDAADIAKVHHIPIGTAKVIGK